MYFDVINPMATTLGDITVQDYHNPLSKDIYIIHNLLDQIFHIVSTIYLFYCATIVVKQCMANTRHDKKKTYKKTEE